jgi:PAS domain S-box-containing protein
VTRSNAAAEQRLALERALAELAEAHVELARRQSFTDALLETVGVGIISCAADGSGWLRNSAARRILGLDADADASAPAAAAPLMDVLDSDRHRVPEDRYPLVRALQGEQVGSVELLLGPAGGPHREVISYSSQILGPAGELLGAVSALTDVSEERAISRALAEQRRKLTESQRLGQLGSFTFDPTTNTFTHSDQLRRNWGLEPDDDVAVVADTLVHSDDRELVQQQWERALAEGGHREYHHRIVRPDGEVRYLRTNLEVSLNAAGRAVMVHGSQLDVTDLTLAKQDAQRASVFLDAVLAASPDYTFVTDLATGAVIYGSPGKDILGLSTARLEGLGRDAALALIHRDDQPLLREINAASADLADGQVLQLRYRGRHTDGQWHWLHRRVTPFRRDAAGRVVEVLGVVRDISDLVRAEDRLTHAALHDGLTGLPNRELLMDRLATALARSGRDGREVAVLFCDLDGFKHVNDTAGHAAGDAVLIESARRLQDAVRDEDTVARVGGDEFVVVIEPWKRTGPENLTGGVELPAQRVAGEPSPTVVARQVAHRIAEALRLPITVAGVDHTVSASIGVAYSSHGRDRDVRAATAEDVLQEADAAMYRAKAAGKNRVEISVPSELT